MAETFFLSRYQSPLGEYVLLSSRQGVICLKSAAHVANHLARWQKAGIRIQESSEPNQKAIAELDAYFAGNLRNFSVPLDLRGTDFQHKVWELLLGIPYGETRSYGDIARLLGHPAASRAVGRAVGTNPVAIIVPCHRVIGASGDLVGYGGGLYKKRALLDLEARVKSGLK